MEFEKLSQESQDFIKKNYYKVFNKEFSNWVYTPSFGMFNRVNFEIFNEWNKIRDFVELTYGFNKDVDLYITNLVFLPILSIHSLDFTTATKPGNDIKNFVQMSL